MAKLELTGNGFYMDPWRSEFRIVNPVKVEAKIITEEGATPKQKKKKVSVKLVEDEVVIPKKGDKRKIIIDDEEETAKSLAEDRIEKMKEAVDLYLSDRSQPKPSKKAQVESKKKKVKTHARPDQITENDVYRLMEAKGLKNQKTQEAIIERAKDMCFKDGNTGPNPEEVYEVVEKMLSTKVLK